PPVDISPHTRLRARFCPAVNCSVATFFQSHSSSSTTSWARPVSVPCPISERAIRITQVSLGFTNTQALISAPAAAAACAAALERPKGRLKPSARPPPAAAAERRMNLRRFMSNLLSSGQVDRRADALIGAALRDPAAVFGAGEAHLLADHPEQGGIGLRLHVAHPAVDIELCHRCRSSRTNWSATLRPPGRRGNC